MKRLLLFFLVMFSFSLFVGQRAYAHVLVTDQTGKKGAILHIVPDDDPVAGKNSTLFFDLQDDLLDDEGKVTLSIAQTGKNKPIKVKTKKDGSLVTASYIFPHQGVYFIRYDIKTLGFNYTFHQTTRVSRGLVAETLEKPRYTWAEGLLVGCGVSLLCLVILAWNHRKGIIRQSTF